MFGRRKDNDGTHQDRHRYTRAGSTENPPAHACIAPTAPWPRCRAPRWSKPPRRAPDVTATTGRRPEVRPSPAGDNEGKKLIVGREIVLTGEIRACDRLVVEGRVEAALTDSRSIEIAATGMFKGKAQIDTAEISGRFEGDLVVNQKLVIHSTGRVVGNIRYGQIEIARGGDHFRTDRRAGLRASGAGRIRRQSADGSAATTSPARARPSTTDQMR